MKLNTPTLFASNTVLLFVIAVFGMVDQAAAENDKHRIDNYAEANLTEALEEMGYGEVEISGCWVSFVRSVTPSPQNGWTSEYTRFVNLDYFKEFSEREIQQLGQGANAFYGFETRLDNSYPLRPLTLVRFKEWVESNYPGANWPHVTTSVHRGALTKIESYLAYAIPNIGQLNRWVSVSQYGKSTDLKQFFQITWKERKPLERLLERLKAYGRLAGCNMES